MAAVWYCGSDQYANVAVWQASHTYAVGAFVRQVSPTDANARVFRASSITTGISSGSEPSWNVSKGATTTDTGVTWTEVTGVSTYGWSAASKRISNIDANAGWMSSGDTLYVSNGHNYSAAAQITIQPSISRTIESQIICVNPGGSVPPVAADLSTGATEQSTGANAYHWDGCFYANGFNFLSGAALGGNNATVGACTLENCNLTLNNSTSGSLITAQPQAGGAFGQAALWRNVKVKFGAVGQGIVTGDYMFDWRGGSVDAAGSAPTNLFKAGGSGSKITLEGLDLSALGTNQIFASFGGPGQVQVVNCTLGTGYAIDVSNTSYGGLRGDMVISDAGTGNYKHERHWYEGDLTTEVVVVRSGGANDGVTPFSWKIVTSANSTYGHPFEGFEGAIWNTVTGSAKHLRFEILSSGSLHDNDLWVEVEYLGTSASPISSLATSASAPIGSGSALPSSTATWTTTGVGTPTPQYISVTFTPQLVGMVRWRVCVAKKSAQLWFDPAPQLS